MATFPQDPYTTAVDSGNCILCNRPDDAEAKMVQCDGCNRWYHYSCAGVGDSIEQEDKSYHCVMCKHNTSRVTTSTKSTTSSVREARLRLELQQLAEERELQEKLRAEKEKQEREFLVRKYKLLHEQLDEDDGVSFSSGRSSIKGVDKVRGWISQHTAILSTEIGKNPPPGLTLQPAGQFAQSNVVAVTKQGTSSQAPVPHNMVRPSNIEVKLKSLDVVSPVSTGLQGTLSKEPCPLSLLPPLLQSTPRTTPVQLNTVKQPAARQSYMRGTEGRLTAPLAGGRQVGFQDVPQIYGDGERLLGVGRYEVEPPLAEPAPPFAYPNSSAAVRYHSEPWYGARWYGDVNPALDPSTKQNIPRAPLPTAPQTLPVATNPQLPNRPHVASASCYRTPMAAVPNPQVPFEEMQVSYGPSAQQLAARHVIPKDLPSFSGNPTEWPIFWSSFETSTQMCGYSDAENLMRLQSCLKGDARKAVSSFLLHPSNVPEIIHTLRILFGRPETIISTLLSEVRATPTPRPEKLETIIGFGLTVRNFCAHLVSTGQHAHLANPVLLQELVDKLPANIKLDWALYKQRTEAVDLKTFADYMDVIVTAASSVTPVIEKSDRVKGKAAVHSHVADVHVVSGNGDEATNKPEVSSAAGNDRPCVICNTVGHKPKDCSSFKSKTLEDKWKAAQEFHLCRRCLYPHGKWPCRASTCGVDGCQERHHRLLHPGNPLDDKNASVPTAASVVTVHQNNAQVLFCIIPVLLHANGKSVPTFAFLDGGSDSTLMERSLAEELGLQGPVSPLCMQWTNGVQRVEEESQKVRLNISGLTTDKQFSLRGVQTVDGLELPRQTVQFDELKARYSHLNGLPVQSYSDATPGILIGLDNTNLKTPLKIREGQRNEPVAVKTRLGWVLYGRSEDNTNTSSHRVLHVCTKSHDEELHELVKGFFSMESVGVSVTNTMESAEDQRAKQILQSTTVRTSSGRFETGLLWKMDQIELPNSRPMAERRLKCLERRLLKTPDLHARVGQQIKDYEFKGYAHRATQTELEEADPKRTWFLPLGVVVNPKKPDKIRVVWDAAAAVLGVSLNSVLLKGPDMLCSLLAVLSRYRQREIALSGDIMDMFHQVIIRLQDRTAQWFLWRDNPSDPIQVYVMDVATFGSRCSPTSAQYVKNINAEEYAAEFPKAAAAIKDNHYVDDYLDSVDTADEAVQLALDVKTVHEKAGLQIRHWMSNSPEVLQRIGEQNTQSVKSFTMDKGSNLERVLGMVWLPHEDVFSFALTLRDDLQRLLDGSVIPTKRLLVSLVMSIFDPLGLVAPFVILGKMIVQEVWRSGVDWDDEIPAGVLNQWEQWIKLLIKLDTVKIPRCYFPNYGPETYESLELHIFVDASKSAYAAVGYFRVVDEGSIRCSLVSAKTKVAPLKLLSVPRLELQAAVIGTRLMKTIVANHTLPITRKLLWSDSATVLSWLRSDPRKYKQYVAFRVTEILDDTDVSEWRYVPSRLNVADEATKWGHGPCFTEQSRWFRAPEFLYKEEHEWPVEEIGHAMTEELPVEESGQAVTEELLVVQTHAHQRVSVKQVVEFERFSKWERLARAVAYAQRFMQNYLQTRKGGSERRAGDLTSEELRDAESTVWKLIQADEYPAEYSLLHNNLQRRPEERKRITKSSKLYKLSPFLDSAGVMRMESRVGAAKCISDETKHPVVLPKDHYVTMLVLNWYHRKFAHGNNETVVNEVRQKFYVSKLRAAVGKVSRCCAWCRVYKSKPYVPRMGPLPPVRLTPYVRAFTYTGLDYFGPITVQFGRGGVKRWVALFTCLTTRGVHLEKVDNLSTESCKKAIRRFIGRRGAPLEIYSDQGTNFQGASAELKRQMSNLNHTLATTFTNAETQWKFNPPYAPHMGGVWERLVQSVKNGLAVIEPSHQMDDETLATVITEVESMVNSRPITYLPIDSEESEALTPNHFLLLSSRGVVQPSVKRTNKREALQSNWAHIQSTLDSIWTRWIREYLPVIAEQSKWFEEGKSVEVGDLVIIVNEEVRNSWIRGRIVKVYPGRDGRVRSADVETSTGILQRPVTKLAVLELKIGGMASTNV